MQKTIKRVWNTITTILVSLMVILAVLLWGVKLLGMDVFVVQSGSMEPAYHVGSLVYVKPVDVAELKAGDVITFELGAGVRGTHRIVEVQNTEGQLSFITKGDNNEYVDASPVNPDRIIGKVRFTIPQLGYLITYVQQPPGTYITLSVVAVLLLLTILPDIIFPEEKKSNKQEETK
jgi:signal peptidase